MMLRSISLEHPSKLLYIIILILCCADFAGAQSNSNVQSHVDSLVSGISSLDDIKSSLGEPESQRKVFEWWGGWRDGRFEGFYTPKTLESQKAGLENITKRTLYDLSYAKLGLVVSVFDSPWRLHSLTVQTPTVSVLGINVGNRLRKVEKTLGDGEWSSSDTDDYWWLSYEDRGVRFGFLRNSKLPKYPMKLARRKVVSKIERFDKKVSFT